MVHCKSYDAYCFSCPSYDTRIPDGTRVIYLPNRHFNSQMPQPPYYHLASPPPTRSRALVYAFPYFFLSNLRLLIALGASLVTHGCPSNPTRPPAPPHPPHHHAHQSGRHPLLLTACYVLKHAFTTLFLTKDGLCDKSKSSDHRRTSMGNHFAQQ